MLITQPPVVKVELECLTDLGVGPPHSNKWSVERRPSGVTLEDFVRIRSLLGSSRIVRGNLSIHDLE